MRCTRRAVLTGLGAAGLATAAAAEHPRTAPDHVTLNYDTTWLERYQPRLAVRHLNVQPLALHALRATSPEYEYEWGVYWAEYSHQDGVTSYDSHYRDHEPVYVAVDADGAVAKVLYSAYHWLKAETTTPPLDGTHPALFVVRPWHHYVLDGKQRGTLDIPLRDLTASIDKWLANGLENDLRVGAVHDPATMDSASDWWREGTFGISLEAFQARLTLQLGLYGADNTDL